MRRRVANILLYTYERRRLADFVLIYRRRVMDEIGGESVYDESDGTAVAGVKERAGLCRREPVLLKKTNAARSAMRSTYY